MSVHEEDGIYKKFGENCYFSHGTNYSSGICIIIPKCIEFKLIKAEKDNDGRYLIVSGVLNDKETNMNCKVSFMIIYSKL